MKDFYGKEMTTEEVSNVFYDSYEEVKHFYKKYVSQVWDKSLTLCLADTHRDIGLFPKSDIVVIYSVETHLPLIVTERIFRSNYSKWDWIRMKIVLRNNVKMIKREFGFNLSLSIAKDYLDYIHFKEDWWTLAKGGQQVV